MEKRKPGVDGYERRFGVIAVEMGFVTSDQLVDAIGKQVLEDLNLGQHRLLGQIFRDQALMNAEQIERVLAATVKN